MLRQDGAKLNQVGAVGGLAPGERIYAVRFMGERGYVVTFVQQFATRCTRSTCPIRPRPRSSAS